MLNKEELRTKLEAKAKTFKWDLEKGQGKNLVELFLETLDYILNENEVAVMTVPAGQVPGKGKMK